MKEAKEYIESLKKDGVTVEQIEALLLKNDLMIRH